MGAFPAVEGTAAAWEARARAAEARALARERERDWAGAAKERAYAFEAWGEASRLRQEAEARACGPARLGAVATAGEP